MALASLKSGLFFIKIAELIMSVVCAILASVYPYGLISYEYFYKMEVVHGTFIGFSLVSCLLILCYVTGDPIKPPVVLVVCATAAVMYLASAIFAFQAHVNYVSSVGGAGNLIGAGVMAMITFAVYLADMVFVYRNVSSTTG